MLREQFVVNVTKYDVNYVKRKDADIINDNMLSRAFKKHEKFKGWRPLVFTDSVLFLKIDKNKDISYLFSGPIYFDTNITNLLFAADNKVKIEPFDISIELWDNDLGVDGNAPQVNYKYNYYGKAVVW